MRTPEEASRRRRDMVDQQVRSRGICLPAVLAAMEEVPREDFLAENVRDLAYDDAPVSILEGQTMSQPYVVAYMVEALAPEPGSRVLEIGTGCGYAAAVLSRVVREVFTVERKAILAETAAEMLQSLGFRNVRVHLGDGTLGWPAFSPFDGILVSAGAPRIPPVLADQLAIGGRMVIPVGSRRGDQQLIRLTRQSEDHFSEEDLGLVRFVPLIGRQGWAARSEREAIDPIGGESG